MHYGHLLLCAPAGRPLDEAICAEAATRCDDGGARLSVVVPVVDSTAPDGCCGIQGLHWERLVREALEEDLRLTVTTLANLECPPERAELRVGRSVTQVVERTTDDWRCEDVLVPPTRRPFTAGGLSRRDVRVLRNTLRGDVITLGRAGR